MVRHQKLHDFVYGASEEMAPGLCRITARNPGPFTFHGSGTFILGDNTLAVIDPGPALDSHFTALLEAIDSRPVSHIVVTHRHADHAGLARRLATATRAPIYAHGSIPAPDNLAGESSTRGFHPDIEVDEGDLLESPEWRFRVLHTPGHTSDHICLVEPDRRWLFCGDHVMAWSTSVILPPDGNMADYISSLNRLLDYSDHCFWPTHGSEIPQPQPYLLELLEHRRQRERAIILVLEHDSLSIEEIVQRNYPGLAQNLKRAAGQSVLATILDLQQRGVVTTGQGDETRYRLTRN